MKPTVVKIPVDEIRDWDSFHAVFADVMGFPDFYGRNMNAWIDCMTSADEPGDGLTTVHGTKAAGLLLDLGDCTDFARRCPQQYEAILDCSGFVNHRRIEAGEEPLISLSFWNREPSLTIREVDQASTRHPATRPVVEPKGGDKPQPEAEGLSR